MFRAGGRAWATQFHPEVDADIAPHWVEDAVQEQKHLGEELAEQLRTETGEPGSRRTRLCHRITENFVSAGSTSGLRVERRLRRASA